MSAQAGHLTCAALTSRCHCPGRAGRGGPGGPPAAPGVAGAGRPGAGEATCVMCVTCHVTCVTSRVMQGVRGPGRVSGTTHGAEDV